MKPIAFLSVTLLISQLASARFTCTDPLTITTAEIQKTFRTCSGDPSTELGDHDIDLVRTVALRLQTSVLELACTYANGISMQMKTVARPQLNNQLRFRILSREIEFRASPRTAVETVEALKSLI